MLLYYIYKPITFWTYDLPVRFGPKFRYRYTEVSERENFRIKTPENESLWRDTSTVDKNRHHRVTRETPIEGIQGENGETIEETKEFVEESLTCHVTVRESWSRSWEITSVKRSGEDSVNESLTVGSEPRRTELWCLDLK